MTSKAILDAALRLPLKARARLASKLLESLDEPIWEEAMIAGAKIAEQRLRGVLTGKTRGVPEAEAHRLLFGKEKR